MVTTLAWVLTLAAIAGLLVLDLVVSARRPDAISFRAATGWSLFYIATALAFGVVLGAVAGWDLGTQYLAGYVVEKSLSVDNLFVFAIFIALGAALLHAFSFMFAVFGLILLFSAVQLVRHRGQAPSVSDSALVSVVQRVLPVVDGYDGGRLLTRLGGRRAVTPLALVLVALATTDVLFALDSIPAVFGVTNHAYTVFCANAFALLGLRALFFLVSGLLERLVYLSFGLALVLAFIGLKLILEFLHGEAHWVPEISTGASLAVILVLLVATTAASLLKTRRRGLRTGADSVPRASGPSPL